MSTNFSMLIEDSVVKIYLSGRIDATNATEFQEKMKELIGQKIMKLVFYADELDYISSAGLRVIIFAKQKIGADSEVYMIGAKDEVASVLKMSGLDNFMKIQNTFE